MHIARATIEDAPDILNLQHLAYQSEAAIYDDWTLTPLLDTLDDLTGAFGSRQFLKADDGGRIVGSVRAFQDGETCHVERLIVHPQWRRRGIGTSLLGCVETLFPAARRFELFTGHKSHDNVRLYERVGYRECRRLRVNEKVALVFMEKSAGPVSPAGITTVGLPK